MKSIAYVGLDVHESTTSIELIGEHGVLPIDRAKVPTERGALTRYLGRFASDFDLRCCYEASGCGYLVHRWLTAAGISCEVIAPSLIPKRTGRRVKTDRIDAHKLATLYRSGELTAVHVPTAEEESSRRLVRLHDQMAKDVAKTKNHINKFLSSLGLIYRDGSRWTQRHWTWLRSQKVSGTDALVFSEYMALLEYKISRLQAVDCALYEMAKAPQYDKGVRSLCCYRGIGILSAMVFLTEVVDFARFGTPEQLMSYFGLVPSENSSGTKERHGSITKTGNSHCRRAVVEAAWKYARKPRMSRELKARQAGEEAELVAHSMRAQHRLHSKYWSIANRKCPQKAAVAVARELTGFIWAAMTGHYAPREITNAAA
jgi:transposase